MKTTESTRTVGYCRVSTTGQAEEGYSLEGQRRKVTAYCELHDLELVEIIEDAGLSGKSIAGRPGIQRVLELVKTGKLVNVVILKLDRLARNVKEAVEIADLLQKKGVALHSISEKLDTGSASGRLFYNILSAMSQWEREIISERTVAALSVKRDKGERVSGQAPYGYRFADDGNLAIDDTEQATIAKVHELKSEGHSIRAIVDHLREHGYNNRAGKSFGVKEVWQLAKKGRVRRFKNLEEELEALRQSPTAQALLEDLMKQPPERVEQLLTELEEEGEKES